MADFIFNGRSRNTRLRAAEDRAPTREEALAAARAKRARRELEQRQRSAVLKIQAVTRRLLARLAVRRMLLERCSVAERGELSLEDSARVHAAIKSLHFDAEPVMGRAGEAALAAAMAGASPDELARAEFPLTTIWTLARNAPVPPTPALSRTLLQASVRHNDQSAQRLAAFFFRRTVTAVDGGSSTAAAMEVLDLVRTVFCSSDAVCARAMLDLLSARLLAPPVDDGCKAGTFSSSSSSIGIDTILFGFAVQSPGGRFNAAARAAFDAPTSEYPTDPSSLRILLVNVLCFPGLLLGVDEDVPMDANPMAAGFPDRHRLLRLLQNVLDNDAVAGSLFVAAIEVLQRSSGGASGPESPLSAGTTSGFESPASLPRAARWFAQVVLPTLLAETLSDVSGVASTAHALVALEETCSVVVRPYLRFLRGDYTVRGVASTGGATRTSKPLSPPQSASAASSLHTYAGRRAFAVPYISTMVYNADLRLIPRLWTVLSRNTKLWALRNERNELVLRYPHVISLFATATKAYLATAEMHEFCALLGGVAEVRRLVQVFRDSIYQALRYGLPTTVGGGAEAEDDRSNSAHFVASALQVLHGVHHADAPHGLLSSHDWIVATPPPSLRGLSIEEYALAEDVARHNDPRRVVERQRQRQRRRQHARRHPLYELEGEVEGASAGGSDNSGAESDSDSDVASAGITSPVRAAVSQAGSNHEALVRFLSVLLAAPFFVPFEHRVALFSTLLYEERGFERSGRLLVRRHHEFEDSFAKLEERPALIATVSDVHFSDDDGREEMGYGHGVLRDFIHRATEGGFRDPNNGLFKQVDGANTLMVNPHADDVVGGDATPRFAFLGRLLGRAIQEGVLVDVPLAAFTRNAVFGRMNGIADLASYDASVHHNVLQMKQGAYSADALEELDLRFTYTEESLGQAYDVPLVRNGADIAVTSTNVVQYCHLLADYLLNRRCARYIRAFQNGLFSVITRQRLLLFDSNEVQTLIRGHENDIPLDVSDWRRHTMYERMDDTHPAADVFWAAVESMSPAEQREVLKFATSAARAPLLGFAQLSPPFSLELTSNSPDHLPTAATCMCRMRIPRYSNPAQAKEKILQAAAQCQTFEMS